MPAVALKALVLPSSLTVKAFVHPTIYCVIPCISSHISPEMAGKIICLVILGGTIP